MTTPFDDFAEERAAAVQRDRGTWREQLRTAYPIWTSGLVRGFEIGDGWRAITENFCHSLDDLVGGEVACPNLRLTQVKQKFGLIRIYSEGAEGAFEAVQRAIRFTVDRSSSTCEVCGGSGRLIDDRRYRRVACTAHESAGSVP